MLHISSLAKSLALMIALLFLEIAPSLAIRSSIDESICKYWNISVPVSQRTCNASSYSLDWRNQGYDGFLKTDPNFWRYQAQTQFVLTRGLALDFAVQKCKALLTDLTDFRSGVHGPGKYRDLIISTNES